MNAGTGILVDNFAPWIRQKYERAKKAALNATDRLSVDGDVASNHAEDGIKVGPAGWHWGPRWSQSSLTLLLNVSNFSISA